MKSIHLFSFPLNSFPNIVSVIVAITIRGASRSDERNVCKDQLQLPESLSPNQFK